MAAVGQLETVVLAEGGVFEVAIRLVERLLEFLIIHVGEPLEEEEREDISLKIGGIDGATQDVGGLPEVVLKRGEGDANMWEGEGHARGSRITNAMPI